MNKRQVIKRQSAIPGVYTVQYYINCGKHIINYISGNKYSE